MSTTQGIVMKEFATRSEKGPKVASNLFMSEDRQRIHSYHSGHTLAIHREAQDNLYSRDPWTLMNGDMSPGGGWGGNGRQVWGLQQHIQGQPIVAFSAINAGGVDEGNVKLVDYTPDYRETYRNEDDRDEDDFMSTIPEQPAGTSQWIGRHPQTETYKAGRKVTQRHVWKDGKSEMRDVEIDDYQTRPHPKAGRIDYVGCHRIGSCLLRSDGPLPHNVVLPDQAPQYRYDAINRLKRRYYLCSMDEGSYFVSLLERPCKTVEEAFNSLIPKEVNEAKEANIKVIRQGEWFFVPLDIPESREVFYNRLVDLDFKRGGYALPSLDSKSNIHDATRGIQMPKRGVHAGARLVAGKVVHRDRWSHRMSREHESLNFGKQIHMAILNRSLADWTAQGGVD